jgi:hypothetical protein
MMTYSTSAAFWSSAERMVCSISARALSDTVMTLMRGAEVRSLMGVKLPAQMRATNFS